MHTRPVGLLSGGSAVSGPGRPWGAPARVGRGGGAGAGEEARLSAAARPWTRWWIHGFSAVESTLTALLEAYRQAGFGGVEVTPIYGVRGVAPVPFLAERWFELFGHIAAECERLGLGLDFVPGCGWKFGGPHLTLAEGGMDAAGNATGERVKRAGAGGEGFACNPFSARSFAAWRGRFDEALSRPVFRTCRAQFHDSFEYASQRAPELETAFRQRRGYAFPGLPATAADEASKRLLADYRQTLADLHLEDFIRPWVAWAHGLGHLARNQAHGCPANILDVYAAADIPETETYGPDPVPPTFHAFAASAAHVTGKPLVSSESLTWLGEHYHVTLEAMRRTLDRLFLAGVNHVFYHGTAYSPPEEGFPGRVFYAACHLEPGNPLWRHLPALNAYVSRVQAMLREGRPDTDVLLYWPEYDVWYEAPPAPLIRQLGIHRLDWFEGQFFGGVAAALRAHRVQADFVSDRMLAGDLPARYGVIVVPRCRFLPLATFLRLEALAGAGREVVFWEALPGDLPERAAPPRDAAEFGRLRDRFADRVIHRVEEIPGLVLEPTPLSFVRRSVAGGTAYFLVNETEQPVDQSFRPARPFAEALLRDPLSGRYGRPDVRDGRVRLLLAPGESCCLWLAEAAVPRPTPETGAGAAPGVPPGLSAVVTADSSAVPAWPYLPADLPPARELRGWEVVFVAGTDGRLPRAFSCDRPEPWHLRDDGFAGMASYETGFAWEGGSARLELGEVHASAEVFLDGLSRGIVFQTPAHLLLEDLPPGRHTLRLEVVSTAANAVRRLDREGVAWKRFEDVNMIGAGGRPLDASRWQVEPAGLAGPVLLRAVGPPAMDRRTGA
ncbi:MAG: hypothetical protein JXR77_00390 [Lentisphaeria bacterium]|nr:hypothetical protein [Lentisphaeria bacterium]